MTQADAVQADARARTDAVRIPAGTATIEGDLTVPPAARGLVVFAPGAGSSRLSQRNRRVADVLVGGGYATLSLDLLTPEEDAIDRHTAQYRFDIERLARRVVAAIDWAAGRAVLKVLPIACFGASTGAAAAIIAATERPGVVQAVISGGGRPDLAGAALPLILAPTLLIVGGDDRKVIALNHEAMRRMHATVQLAIVAGAIHLFEESGPLAQVSRLALEWCRRCLRPIA